MDAGSHDGRAGADAPPAFSPALSAGRGGARGGAGVTLEEVEYSSMRRRVFFHDTSLTLVFGPLTIVTNVVAEHEEKFFAGGGQSATRPGGRLPFGVPPAGWVWCVRQPASQPLPATSLEHQHQHSRSHSPHS